MKNILVPVEEHALLPQVLETAVMLGQKFGSYLEGLPLTLAVSAVWAAEMAVTSIPLLNPTVRRELAIAGRHHFESFMTERDAGVSFGWYRDELRDDDFLRGYARAFDI